MNNQQKICMGTTSLMLALSLFLQLAISSPCAARHQVFNNLTSPDNLNVYMLNNDTIYWNNSPRFDKWSKIYSGVRSYCFDPNNSNTIFVVNKDNLVFKTLDHGKRWINVTANLPKAEISYIYVNPHNSQCILVCTAIGLYRTTDGGFSWNVINDSHDVFLSLVHPVNSQIYYVLAGVALYVSQDEGSTWTQIKDMPQKTVLRKNRTARQLPIGIKAFNFFGQSSLIAISNDGIITSHDGGFRWASSSNGIDQKEFSRISSLYVDGQTIILGSESSYFTSNDSAKSWNKVEVSLKANRIGQLDGIYYSEGIGGVLASDEYRRMMFFDKNRRVIGLNYGVTSHSNIECIAHKVIQGQLYLYAEVSNNNYVDIENKGLFVSADTGRSWYPSLLNQHDGKIRDNFRILMSPHNNSIWYFVRENLHDRLYYSGDAGTTWNYVAEFVGNEHLVDFCFDKCNSDIMYYCYGTNTYQLYRYDQKNNSRINLNVDASQCMTSSGSPCRIVTNTFKYSNDGGWTWQDISGNLNQVLAQHNGPRIEMLGLNAQCLYFDNNIVQFLLYDADIVNFKTMSFIVTTYDLGRSWQVRKYNYQIDKKYINPLDRRNYFISLSTDTNTFLVQESKDMGMNWQTRLSLKDPEESSSLYDPFKSVTVVGADDAKFIFIGGTEGLFKQGGSNPNWEKIGGVP